MSSLHTKRMCTVSSISHSVVLPWEGEPNAKIVQLQPNALWMPSTY